MPREPTPFPRAAFLQLKHVELGYFMRFLSAARISGDAMKAMKAMKVKK